MKFTVILRYPDYATGVWPDDMYTIVVNGKVRRATRNNWREVEADYVKVIEEAQKRAFKAINKGTHTDEHIDSPEDLEALFVVSGSPMLYCPL
jgi:urease alpha subunit